MNEELLDLVSNDYYAVFASYEDAEKAANTDDWLFDIIDTIIVDSEDLVHGQTYYVYEIGAPENEHQIREFVA